MLDIKLVRENPDKVQKASEAKGFNINTEEIVGLDLNYRKAVHDVQNIQEDINSLNKKINGEPTEEQLESAKLWKKNLKEKEDSVKNFEEKLQKLLLEIPNLPKSDVKIGKGESENEFVGRYKNPVKFSFTPKDHLELGEKLDLLDVKSASKVSGTRFAYLKGNGALLEFAIVQYSLEVLLKEGFIPIIPPTLIRKEITDGLGYWNGGGNEEYYLVVEPGDEEKDIQKELFYLVGTAEHSIVPIHRDEVLNKKDLPKRYVGFSTSFRREAGSYGKDTRGIFRVHQFDKVEMVSFTREENDDKEHEYLLSLEEKLWQALEIPYQVVKMCTGDLGFPVARKYDIEAWIPSQNKYREVTSVSTTTDFQARRLNIKYQDGNEKKFVHILNGTAFAIGRTIIAILENYQQKDGSVEIPKVLQKYIGKTLIKPRQTR